MLPSINFASIPAQGMPAVANALDNFYQGYQEGTIPAQIKNKLKMAALAEQLAKQQVQTATTNNQFLPNQLRANLSRTLLENQFFPKMQNARLGLLNQQTRGAQIENQFAPDFNTAKLNALKAQQNLDSVKALFGGGTFTGNVGDAIKLNNLKNMVGENDPRYQAGLAAYQANLRRFSSTPAKLATDLADAKAGFMPGTGKTAKIAGADQQDAINNLALALQKTRSDSQTRQKALNAANIDKTLNMIDPDALTQYGGLFGTAAKGAQLGRAAVGLESKDYDKYSNQIALVNRLASQVRQFYGDSVMPSNLERLLGEFNTGSWHTNPQLAKQMFNTLKNVLNQETETYRSALKNPSEYEGYGSMKNSKVPMHHDPVGLF